MNGDSPEKVAPMIQSMDTSNVCIEDVVRLVLKGSNLDFNLRNETFLRCWPYFSPDSETAVDRLPRGDYSALKVDEMVEYRDGALCSLRGAAEYHAAAKSWPAQLLEECPDAVCTIVRVTTKQASAA